jgi:hypothetical protein
MPREGLSAIHAKALARISDLKLGDETSADLPDERICHRTMVIVSRA